MSEEVEETPQGAPTEALPRQSQQAAEPLEEVPNGPRYPVTKEAVMRICVKNGYYRTPHCNEILYLQHQGFDAIRELDEYTEVRVLWLQGNCIHKIENLEPLAGCLRMLYLHENMIDKMENLFCFAKLEVLNVSDNCITRIEGFDRADGFQLRPTSSNEPMDEVEADEASATAARSPYETLGTLQIKNNRLKHIHDIEQLPKFVKLHTLDISNNKLEDGEGVLSVLQRIPTLKSLYLFGNPCVRKIPNYRKRLLTCLPQLLYLDDKPVFDEERRLTAAWAVGGPDGEKKVRALMKVEEEEKVKKRLNDFRSMMAQRPASTSESTPPALSESNNNEDGKGDVNDDEDQSSAEACTESSTEGSEPVVEQSRQATSAAEEAPLPPSQASELVQLPDEEEAPVWIPPRTS